MYVKSDDNATHSAKAMLFFFSEYVMNNPGIDRRTLSRPLNVLQRDN